MSFSATRDSSVASLPQNDTETKAGSSRGAKPLLAKPNSLPLKGEGQGGGETTSEASSTDRDIRSSNSCRDSYTDTDKSGK